MRNTKKEIELELEATRKKFHVILDSLSDADFKKQSKNPGWTNGEILFHMTFGFIILYPLLPLVRVFCHLPKSYSKVFAKILNAVTPFFNWINALGARGGGKIFNKNNIGKRFDSTYSSILKKLDSLDEAELDKGMYYPQKWDALFDEYMTIEKLFRYPIKHFNFHNRQLKLQ